MPSPHTRFHNTDATSAPDAPPARHVFMGLSIAAVGTLALLDNLRLFDIALLRTFWPLGLVMLGLARLVLRGRQRMAGAALVLVGAMLTASNLGSDLFALRHWWPVFIIGAGLSMLRRR
ncbi:LiaI-LiaF-like domain-containing protein [Roseateles sp. DC23W]|uniref:LiaI-LiaF-like domain-containing protein n=1 Tax=Pelomonas dachongensis TaxID=3299029 RepID=A0ABW7EPI7_9BURK